MTLKEKLNMLEELLDIDRDSLEGEEELAEISQWDSMARIGLIALVDEVYGKVLEPDIVKEFKSIKDIIDIME